MKTCFPLCAALLALSAFACRLSPASESAQYPDVYDVVWDSPSADHHGSMPLGNGDIGINVWAEDKGEIAFYIGKTDSWDEYGRLVKVGGARIRIEPNPFGGGKPFRQRLRLRDATVEIEAGEGAARTLARIWVDAENPAIYVEIESSEPTEAVASIVVWRTERRELESLETSDVLVHREMPGGRHAPTILEPDTILEGGEGWIGWYHHNSKSVGPELLAKIQGLSGFPQPDPLLGRTFGAAILARRGERADDRTLRSLRGTQHRFSVFVLTRHPSTPEAWLEALRETMRRVEAKSFEDRRKGHEAWWREFWSRSWICAAARPGADTPIVPENRYSIRIGFDQGGGNRFAGEIGRVSVFSKALPDAEIRALAALGPEEPAPAALGALFSGRPEKVPSELEGSSAWSFARGFTIEAWAKPEKLPGGGARIADKLTPGVNDGFLLDTYPGNSARSICGDAVVGKEGAAPPGKWTHLAATADAERRSLRLFVDGKLAAEGPLADSSDEPFLASRAYHLQRFMNACAGRGAHPIKFNGSIFTVPAPGGTDPDYRRWGPGYWWQNTRLPYFGMCASGDFDLMGPLFRMYADELLELCKYRTKLYCGHEGAFYPECMYFWGAMFSETYGWTPFEERTDKLQESRWHKWEWVGGLELSWLMLDYYEHTLDRAFLEKTAIPFVREILTFFEKHYPLGPDGKLVFHPAQALETWWECTNPMPEIAGCRAVAERCLKLPEEAAPAADRELWRRLLEKLPPIPLREIEGKKALAPAEKFSWKQNIENPELYAVFPFRLFAAGKPNIEWALEALRHRSDRGNFGWRQDDIFMAYLGLAEEAREYLVGRAKNHDKNSRFPAFWGPNYDWTPDQCHGGVLVKTLQAMLLQTDGRRILLFPAWPRAWDVRFKLRAPFATTVEGEYRDGKLLRLNVEPESRRADVEISGGKVSIIRDEWGVPRIFADSMEAAAFAFGYAQAEDRLEAILKAYLHAEGRMASVFGGEYAEGDFHQIVLRHPEVSRARYGELSPQCRALAEAFVAGIRKYMDEHPARVPSWGFRPEPAMVLALARTVTWPWPVGQAFEDLGRALPSPRERGSNQWAVAPERTALGCAVLAIDPHVELFGLLRWYECHVHGGPLHVYGFAVPGTPFVALGHNDYIAWACTTGGPDTSDIYEVELDRPDGLRYRYDGEWREVETREVEIPVRDPGGMRIVKRVVRRTHHGPIVREAGTRAFAMKIPYEEEVRLADQLLAFNLARSLNDFRHACELAQFFPQNLMVADVDGNIFYIRTGRVPIRPPGVDPSRPIPGGTSKTEWLGLRRQAELVQCLNPSQGFFQNCNVGPDTMLPDSPMTREKYPPDVYNASPGATNPRGRRAIELLSRAAKLDLEGAIAILLDTGVSGFEGWIKALAASADELASEAPEERARIEEPLEILRAWDGFMEAESEGATLFYAWKMALRELAPKLGLEAAPDPGALSKPEKLALARAFLRAVSELEKRFGSSRLPWGRVNRIRRGERSFPAGGASPARLGFSTLRAVAARAERDGTLVAVTGQTCPTVVALEAPGRVRSFSALPFGESDDPSSPHFTDQAEKLFSPKKLKDTHYRREEVLEKVESVKTLEVPQDLPRAHPMPPARPVSAEEVEEIARLVATPYKLGRPVLEPTRKEGDFDAQAVDCPNVFRFRGRWYMTYVGFDGTGYATGLAASDDLLSWERLGKILGKGSPGAFDSHGAAGLSILGDTELFSGHEPYRVRGRYWLSYYGNDAPGYEAGYGSVGLAWSADLRTWTRFEKNPILSPRDGAAWERGTLYKSYLFRGPDGNFAILYNAKDRLEGPWVEETGLATSPDLETWARSEANPVLPRGPEGSWDSVFASDPIAFRHGDLWVLFYYGFDGRHARNGLAASRDLVRWTKLPRPILDVGEPGAIDSQHAHKPSVVWDRGVFYHFYCAVRDRDGYRTITVAASKPLERGGASDPAALRLIPFPKEAAFSGAAFRLDRKLVLEAEGDLAPLAARLLEPEFRAQRLQPPSVRGGTTPAHALRIAADASRPWSLPELPGRGSSEEYSIEISEDSATLRGASRAGLLHALQTLRQLIRANLEGPAIPALRIRDWPSIRWRAFQDDITRGPSSTLEELQREVELGAYFRHNIFTYYMQSQFAFRKHPDIGPPDGSLTAEELRALVRFAEPLGVAILGNQQSFAHLQDILRLDAYAHLREDARTLSPVNEGTYRLLDDLYSEVIPVLPFEFFNVCCDETFGLGSGPSKELAEKIGAGGVYLRHILRVHELVSGKYGKRMMMWGDIILQHPDKIAELPRNIVLLTWGYAARENFEDQIVPFARSGHEFFVCPGVKCWSEVLPNFRTAAVNIKNFVRDGAKHGAIGVLNTSWDDDGENLNAPSWHGFAWGAECAWNASATRYEDFQDRIGAVLFGERGRKFADAIEALSAKQAKGYDGFTNATFWTRDGGPIPLADAAAEIARLEEWIADVRRAIKDLETVRAEAKANAELLDAFLHGARRFELFASRRRDRIEAALAYKDAALGKGDAALACLERAEAAIRRTREAYASLREGWRKLWLRENRPYALDPCLARYDAEIARLDRMLSGLASAREAARRGEALPAAAELGLEVREPEGKGPGG